MSPCKKQPTNNNSCDHLNITSQLYKKKLSRNFHTTSIKEYELKKKINKTYILEKQNLWIFSPQYILKTDKKPKGQNGQLLHFVKINSLEMKGLKSDNVA